MESKHGFTLTELVFVTALVVLASFAAIPFLGYPLDWRRYNM